VFNYVVNDVSYAGSSMRSEIFGLERRRFWREEDKLEIVASAGIGRATVTQVAQRHEITRQQIYAWRHDLKKRGLWSPDTGSLFSPVDIPVATEVLVPQPSRTETPPQTAVELRFRSNRCLHFDSTMDPVARTATALVVRW